jgi:hypothetical protein
MREGKLDESEVQELFEKNLVDGKLPCIKAFKLYESSGISLEKIGDIANELKIKISACQLGCFK